jgi:hypothetical protein
VPRASLNALDELLNRLGLVTTGLVVADEFELFHVIIVMFFQV